MRRIFESKSICIFLLLLLKVSITASGQCIVTGNNNGSIFINESSGTGSIPFSNTSNAETFGNGKAIATVTLGTLLSGKSSFLKATGFNFSIPDNATICGITVEIRKRAAGINLLNSIKDEEVKLVKAGVISGDSKAKAENWTDTDTYFSYGGTADLWGHSLTSADVNDADFGVAISAAFNGANTLSAEIDHISIAVSYNSPTVVLPLVVVDFKSSIKKNIVTHIWKIADVEPNSSIIIQKKSENTQWQDLNHYKNLYHQYNKIYTYRDTINGKNTYLYRLKLISANGSVSYSKINKLNSINHHNKFQLSPNPASNNIYIKNTNRKNSIFIYNNIGMLMRININWLNENEGVVNIQKLSKGTYYLINGIEKQSFIKE